MADTKIEQNTDELEKVLQMVNNLPEGSSSSDPYKINPDLNLLVLGDSLFDTTPGRAWVKSFGCNVANYAKSSASIARVHERAYKNGTYNSLLDQLDRFQADKPQTDGTAKPFDTPDMILIDGGGNDYLASTVLGTVTSDLTFMYTDPIDSTNFEYTSHALFYLLRRLSLAYPKAQKFFMIMHRVYQCDETTFTSNKKYLWATTDTFLRARNFTVAKKTETDDEGNVIAEYPETTITTFEKLYVDLKEVTTIDEIKKAVNGTNAEGTDKKNIYVYEYLKSANPETEGETRLSKRSRKVIAKTLFVNEDTTGEVSTSKVKTGYNYNTLRETIIKECNKFGVKIIDLYNDCPLNASGVSEVKIEPMLFTNDDETTKWEWGYVHPITEKNESVDVAYTNKNGKNEEIHSSIRNNNYKVKLPNLELTGRDHIHPTELGYKVGYDSYVRQALCLATKK